MEKVKLTKMPRYISGIYKIDFPNGKSYVGQSLDIKKRVQEHNQRAKKGRKDREIQLCEYAIKKYGEVEEFWILEKVNQNDLDEREKYWIAFYDTLNRDKGYNLLDHGDVSGRRGFDNSNCKLEEEIVNKVIQYIIDNPDKSLRLIGEKFNLSPSVMCKINQTGYGLPQYCYPLRESFDRICTRRNLITLNLSEQTVLDIKKDLLNSWWLTIEKDIPKKYNVSKDVIRMINHGRLFQEIGSFNYPIRKKNANNRVLASKQDALDMLSLLRNSNLSMSKIGKKFGKGRAFVSNVNQGKSCFIPEYDYPARQI